VALIRLGTDYGGWIIPDGILDADSVVWCVGAGEDISFDVALIARYGCSVHCIDPTPRAAAHVEQLRAATEQGQPMPINGQPDQLYDVNLEGLTRLRFHPVGLYDRDEVLRFYEPRKSEHVSHSIVNLQSTAGYFEAQCRSPRSLTDKLGHDRIDLLKLDIEGAEHVVLDHLQAERIFPRVLCIEFDYAALGGRRREAVAHLRRLARAGYTLVHHRSWNVTLVRGARSTSRTEELLWGLCCFLGLLPPRGPTVRSQ